MAKSKLMIDNSIVRVTEWEFDSGVETGQHIQEYDYIVVPMKDRIIKIINDDGSVTLSELKKGISYFREKGVNHNVINENKFHYSFVEIEIK